jgi:hypothetical protein
MLIENATSRRNDTIEIEERDLMPVIEATQSPELVEHSLADYDREDARFLNRQAGKIGWAILWLLGVPLPVLLVIYLIRGH